MAPVVEPDRCTLYEWGMSIAMMPTITFVKQTAKTVLVTTIFYNCLLNFTLLAAPFPFYATAVVGVVVFLVFFWPTAVQIADLRRHDIPPDYESPSNMI